MISLFKRLLRCILLIPPKRISDPITVLLTSVTASLQTHIHVRCKRWPVFFCFALFFFVLSSGKQHYSFQQTHNLAVSCCPDDDPCEKVDLFVTPISPSMWWSAVTSAVSFAILIQISAAGIRREHSNWLKLQHTFLRVVFRNIYGHISQRSLVRDTCWQRV